MVTAVVLGAILLAAMLITAGYAMKTLPRDARVPVNAGVPEASVWLSRVAGLAAWLGAGVVVYVVAGAITVSGTGAGWFPSVRMSLLPAVMVILLAGEVGAVITARRRAGLQSAPEAAEGAQSGHAESQATAESEVTTEASAS